MSCCGSNKKRKQNPIVKKIRSISTGWKNLLTGEFKHKPFVKDRAQICSRCKHLNKTTKFCKLCGCFIPAKITVKKESCPFKYWGVVK